MAGPPIETDVVFDADGRQVLTAVDLILSKMNGIQKAVTQIVNTANGGGKDFEKALDQTMKNLTKTMGQMQGLAKANNQPAYKIQDLNANRQLAQQTVSATNYARELNTARSAADALQAKIAKLNQTIASRGRDGGFATVGQTDQLKRLEAASAALKKLDAQYDALEAKARQSKGASLAPQITAVADARSRLTSAALDGRRTNLTGEINGVTDAQAALAERIAMARREETKAIQTGFQARKEVAIQDAAAFKTATELDRARAQSAERIRALRTELATATDAERSGLLSTLEIEKARGRQLEANARSVDSQTRAEAGLGLKTTKALIPSQMRSDASTYGAQTVSAGAQLEKELALKQLSAAQTDAERIAALQSLDIANAKVAAAKALVAEETEELRLQNASNEAARKNSQANDKSLAGASARGDVANLGLYEARAAAAQRVADAEARIAGANGINDAELRAQLLLEEKKLGLINQEVAAREREVAAQARATAASEKQAIVDQKKSIGGRLGTAAFNTALYSSVAAIGFGALNAAQQGIAFAMEFEDELAKLQAIANATTPQMQQLKAAILDVGNSSRFSVVDLTKISETLAQAGVSAGDMKQVLTAVSTLATASGSSPDEAVNLVTSALGAFQLQASEAARVADLMTTALNRTKLTVQQTGQAIQYVGATAFEQNISLETLLATVGTIAQAGVKSGSTIGTGLRQLLVDLTNPSKKLQEQLDLLKLSSSDVDVSVRGLPAVLDTLAKAGFGAGQAYAGLETRAASAFLVLKNNRDVMDGLSLSLTNSGAAAVANERAMNSLTAQWQRFKNLLASEFSDSMEKTMTFLQNVITALSDRIDNMKKVAGDIAKANADGTANAGNYDLGAGASSVLRQGLNIGGKVLQRAGGDTSNNIFTDPTKGGFGDWLDSWTTKAGGASAASEKLATAVSETAEKADTQRNIISELGKEYQRLIVQKESLVNNDQRSAIETANLTSRFQGLAVFLDSTKTRYNSLTDAIVAFNKAQAGTLVGTLQSQNSQLALQKTQAGQTGGAAINSLLSDSSTKGVLSADDRASLAALRTAAPNSQEAQKAIGILSGDMERIGKASADIAARVNTVIQSAQTIASNVGLIQNNNAQIGNARAGATPIGQDVFKGSAQINGLITQLGSADREQKDALSKQAYSLIDKLTKEVTNAKPGTGPDAKGNARYLADQLVELKSMRQQVTALVATTKDEKAAADKAEREAKKGPKAGQADVDALGKVLGLTLGSGRRTEAEEDALHRAGKTRATGKTSGHSRPDSAGARDFLGITNDQQGELAEAAARKYFKDAGIDAYVKYENGKGKNNGTGKHLHVNLLPGARVKPGGPNKAEGTEFDRQDAIDKAGTAVDQRDFTQTLAEIKKGAGDEVIKSGQVALDKLSADLKRDAITELAKQGIFNANDPLFKQRMQQVDDTIAQNVDLYHQAIADGLIKSVTASVKAATEAFNDAIRPQTRELANAQASASGLDSYSLQNKVPDYVKTLADQRSKLATENLQKAQQANLPTEIASQQSAIDKTTAGLQAQTPDSAGYVALQAQLVTLKASMADLVTQKQTLDAALGAGSQVPTTLTDGLNKAIEAYQATHNMTNTFKQDVIDTFGTSIQTVSDGLNTMFTSILDGSQNALQAFGSFAKGILKAVQEMVAKIIATKILSLLFSLVGGKSAAATNSASFSLPGFGGSFDGGPAMPEGLLGGGQVTNGSTTHDSVTKRLARGEWVVNRRAVDSVGNDFMANLNRHGSKAIAGMGSVPVLPPPAHQETSVYVVAPTEKPSMGPNDVLVAIQSDILSGGETKKLIKYVANGG